MDSQFPQIAKWFNTVDKDRSGRLTSDQLQEALRNNNYTTFDPAVVELGLKTKCLKDYHRKNGKYWFDTLFLNNEFNHDFANLRFNTILF